MFNFPRRPALTRAGLGAVLVALVAIAGYNLGLAQSPSAAVSAAQSAVRTSEAPHLKASDTTTSYAPVVDAVAPAVVTVPNGSYVYSVWTDPLVSESATAVPKTSVR